MPDGSVHLDYRDRHIGFVAVGVAVVLDHLDD
jgi:hypothetical protein